MTLIEDVARIAELEKAATPAPWSLDMQIDPKKALRDAKLMIAMRNALPKILGVLGAFQDGDAEALEDLAKRVDIAIWEDVFGPRFKTNLAVLRRLAEAARKMEAKK